MIEGCPPTFTFLKPGFYVTKLAIVMAYLTVATSGSPSCQVITRRGLDCESKPRFLRVRVEVELGRDRLRASLFSSGLGVSEP